MYSYRLHMGLTVIVFTLNAVALWSFLWPSMASQPAPLRLALTPSQSPTSLQEPGEEFARVLTQLVGIPVKLFIASDYVGVIEALRSQNVDLAFVHPVGYVLASREARCRIIAKDVWHGKTSFTARLWVHQESHIQGLEELRGKTIAFVDPASSSGYIYPMVMLIKRGLIKNRDPKTFFKEVLFAGSHDAALLALLSHHVDATASFDTAPEQYLKVPCHVDATTACPDEARIRQLRYVAETEPIPEAGICGRADLAPLVIRKVFEALMAMNAPEYRPLLAKLYNIDGFAPAEDADYNPVRDAVELMGFTGIR
jgi:phosphonate transport system substrate-binding protein